MGYQMKQGEPGPGGERIFLGLGSNLGDRLRSLSKGLEILEDNGVKVLRVSSVFDTDPVGFLEQDAFLNLVAEVAASLPPRDLLELCLLAENTLGRVRGRRDGPRTLDIDILLWGHRIHQERGLEIPHPRLHERRFVLVPLEEIAAEVLHPALKVTMRDLLERCSDRSGVRRFPLRVTLERGNPSGYNPAASRGKQP
jgi:2-amino-4-hydroxy-6-hydroxymethyldihydropteridine diphosphokinase